MARKLRIEYPGAFYHVFSRGNGKQRIFFDARDYARFLEEVDGMVGSFSWICHAYCLMPNHFHLLVETPEGNLSGGMQFLNGNYSQYFNRRHDRVGHVMQGRFKSPVIRNDNHALQILQYVHLNPIGLTDVEEPGQWRWSSYRAIAGLALGPAFLETSLALELFSRDMERARREFVRFVEDGLASAPFEEPDGRVPLSILLDGARDRMGNARAIRAAHIEHGYSKAEIARFLRVSFSTVSRMMNEAGGG